MLFINTNQSINHYNTMRIYCVPGSILGTGDMAMRRVSTLKEFKS